MAGVPFVDRDVELGVLLGYAERGFYPVLYIFGPEGCGKTRLLKELISRLQGRENYLTVYVDTQSTESVDEAVVAPGELVRVLAGLVEGVGGPVGRAVAQLLPAAFRRVVRSLVRGRHVVVAVDDVARPLGLEVVESYAKKLLDLAEWAMEAGAESVLVLATTSEGESYRLIARHNYAAPVTLWNLPKEPAASLARLLGAPENIADAVWGLTGGNPRAILELSTMGWSLEGWMGRLKARLRHAVAEIVGAVGREALLEAVEDVDKLTVRPELRRMLLEYNLVTPITRPCLGYTPPVDPGLGVGRLYAWQMPAYRQAVTQVLEEGDAAR